VNQTYFEEVITPTQTDRTFIVSSPCLIFVCSLDSENISVAKYQPHLQMWRQMPNPFTLIMSWIIWRMCTFCVSYLRF